MKQELENFIILNEKKIKSLTDDERTELGKIFLKGFSICENVRIDAMTLQKIGEEVFYPAENLTNIK
jgi:hypothetical protein